MVGHLCVVISAIQYTKYKPFDADDAEDESIFLFLFPRFIFKMRKKNYRHIVFGLYFVWIPYAERDHPTKQRFR